MADGSGPQIENNGDRIATDDDCICAENAQKIVAKSESIKLKKHGALTSVELPSSVAVVETLQALTLGFVKPTYLTDSFYNLSLSRGPPARL